jgi:hypothetical protein
MSIKLIDDKIFFVYEIFTLRRDSVLMYPILKLLNFPIFKHFDCQIYWRLSVEICTCTSTTEFAIDHAFCSMNMLSMGSAEESANTLCKSATLIV